MKRAAAAALALTLGACAGPGEQVSPPVAIVPLPPAASPAQPGAAPQVAAAPPVAGARGLVGLSRDALGARLGQAGFVRRDGPAEVWRYRGRDCLLDVFVYRETDGAQRVAHIDARTLQGRPTPPDPCLDALEREKRPSG
ncbi:MAG: hypothetical protein ACKO1J_19200 [Tagaea sp.]